jgi:hypothetical protein
VSSVAKFLGVYIDDELRFTIHIDYICKKVSSVIFALSELRHESDFKCLLTLYYSNFHSYLKYGIVCWGNSLDSYRLFILQKKALRTMFFMNKRDSCQTLFQNLGILTLPCMYIYECALYVKKNESRFREHEINHEHNTRHKYVNIAPKYTRLELYRKGPFMSCLRIFNNLPLHIKNINCINLFSKNVKSLLLKHCFYDVDEFFNM